MLKKLYYCPLQNKAELRKVSARSERYPLHQSGPVIVATLGYKGRPKAGASLGYLDDLVNLLFVSNGFSSILSVFQWK